MNSSIPVTLSLLVLSAGLLTLTGCEREPGTTTTTTKKTTTPSGATKTTETTERTTETAPRR